MSRINTNVSSLIAQRVLKKNNDNLNTSLERLSTGLKINKGADNPAGLIASENLRAEKAGIVHAGVGKASFTDDALVDNVRAFVGAITRGKPTGVKGTYIKRVHLSSTMGPAVPVELAGLAEETRA